MSGHAVGVPIPGGTIVEVGADELLERLATHKTLGVAPRAEHEWLIRHGQLCRFAAGQVVAQKDVPLAAMLVIFTGHVAIRVDRGAGPKKVLEWFGGDVSGTLPYSRMGRPPGTSIAEEETLSLAVARECFDELTQACPSVTAVLVHVMLDRARIFNSSDLLDEKMLALGKLSAGLAHELNNPASAASRSAHVLAQAFRDADEAAMALGSANLTERQRAAIEQVREICQSMPNAAPLAPLERADREDEIASWLEAYGADVSAAPALAGTIVSRSALDVLAAHLNGPALTQALRWIAAGCNTRSLIAEIEDATARIYQLVSVVKRWTYMDAQGGAEVVHVGLGLRDTVVMLGSKAREKVVTMTLTLEEGLPPVRGYGAELNQVWVNILDNAISAAPDHGQVTIAAALESDRVVVSIADDGAGIPADVQGRIFDPFFTTKPVGQGTGMGLEIAQRLVRRSSGELTFQSVPGHTVFRVSFPALAGTTPAPEHDQSARRPASTGPVARDA